MLIRAVTCDNFSFSREVIDVPADVGDEVVADMPVQLLRIKLVSASLAGMIVFPLAGGMFVFDIDMFSEVCCFVLDAVISFDAIDLRAGMIIDTVIGVAPCISVDVLADTDASI